MQKILAFLIAFLALTFIVQAQSVKKKTSLEAMNLHGQPESVREVTYTVKKDGEQWTTDEINGDTRILFNEFGNRRAEAWYHAGSESPHTRFHFTYDANQNKVEYEYVHANETKNSVTSYQYNELGQQVSSKSYDYEDKLEKTEKYDLDEKGNKIQIQRFDADNKLIKTIKYEYEYDSENRISEEKIYYNGEYYGYETYKYSEAGKMAEHLRYKPDGEMKGGDKYKYDEHGNTSEWTYISSGGDRQKIYTYIYTYNEDKNWIEKWQYEDGELKYIIKRDIK